MAEELYSFRSIEYSKGQLSEPFEPFVGSCWRVHQESLSAFGAVFRTRSGSKIAACLTDCEGWMCMRGIGCVASVLVPPPPATVLLSLVSADGHPQ